MLSVVHAADKPDLLFLAQLQLKGAAVHCPGRHEQLETNAACMAVLPGIESFTNILQSRMFGQTNARRHGLPCRYLAQHGLGSIIIVIIVISQCSCAFFVQVTRGKLTRPQGFQGTAPTAVATTGCSLSSAAQLLCCWLTPVAYAAVGHTCCAQHWFPNPIAWYANLPSLQTWERCDCLLWAVPSVGSHLLRIVSVTSTRTPTTCCLTPACKCA